MMGFIDNVAPFEPIVGNYGNVANTDNIIDTPGSNENANWQEVFGGRAALKYFATEKLTATASVIWQKSELGGRFNTNESAVSPLPLHDLEQFHESGHADSWDPCSSTSRLPAASKS